MPKRITIVMLATAMFAGVTILGSVRRQGDSKLDPFELLVTASVPVAIDYEFRPDAKSLNTMSNVRTEADELIFELRGTAKVIFSNLVDQPVKVSFPPRYAFQFSPNGSSSLFAPIPPFAADPRTIEIPAGGSIDFEMEHTVNIVGEEQKERYLQGGHGFLGFVFDPPDSSAKDEIHLAGTVFPHCSTVGILDGDEAMAKRARDARLAMARDVWDDVTIQDEQIRIRRDAGTDNAK